MSQASLRFTRRGFLGATAASAAPLFVPRHVLGDEKNLPANEKIALGCVGIGKMMYGDHLPHYLKMREVKVVAVCDVDTTRRTAGKKRVDDAYGNANCAAYNDYREILARHDIDAVACATPDHWPAIIILDTCKAGKDMYCEKPLANNLAEAKTLMDVVGKSKIIFQVGSQQRADREFRYACELVRNGHLGKIKQVLVGVGGPPKPCNLPGEDLEPGLDWERWQGPAPARSYSSVLSPRGVHNHFPSWRAFCEYGGGGMTDWGAHHFDIAQWGLGMDQSGPVEIVPPQDPKDLKAGRGVKYIYANGVEVIHGGVSGVTFVGEKGEIFVNRGQLTSKPETIIKELIGKNEMHLYQAPAGGHAGHRQDWVNCLRSRKTPNCPIHIGARTVAVCHLGNIAYLHAQELNGKSLKWDPQGWQFVGNDAANQWRNYPYPRRKGYELPVL
jgi:predicted dehydrogenase